MTMVEIVESPRKQELPDRALLARQEFDIPNANDPYGFGGGGLSLGGGGVPPVSLPP